LTQNPYPDNFYYNNLDLMAERWDVTENSDHEFTYVLPYSFLDDGGVYRCRDIEYNLNVVSAELNCGVAPERIIQSSFRPVCKMASSGPDVAEKPFLMWILGSPSNILRILPSVVLNERCTVVQLMEENSSMLHGYNVTCLMEGLPEHVVAPSCVLGPLDVAFEVKMDSLVESQDGSYQWQCFDLLLTGNPAPVPNLVKFTISPGAVSFVHTGRGSMRLFWSVPYIQTEVGPDSSSVIVRVCTDLGMLPCTEVVEFVYEGRLLTTLTFVPTSKSVCPVPTGSSCLGGAAVVFVLLCFVVIVCIVREDVKMMSLPTTATRVPREMFSKLKGEEGNFSESFV
jgi:hypothetical protein